MGFISPLALIGSTPENRVLIWDYHAGEDVESYPPEIHESAIVDAFCTVDAGTKRPTLIGERSWLQKRVHVGHDARIGAHCEIAVGVTIGGWVVIEDDVQVGGNTWIRPRVTIGKGARVGGGSVVVKDVPPGEVWAGNPAKPLRKGAEARRRGQVDYDHHSHFDPRHGLFESDREIWEQAFDDARQKDPSRAEFFGP